VEWLCHTCTQFSGFFQRNIQQQQANVIDPSITPTPTPSAPIYVPWRMVIAKISALAILVYMGNLVITCPCKRLWACHIGKIWIAFTLLSVIIVVENGLPSLSLFSGGGTSGRGGSCHVLSFDFSVIGKHTHTHTQ
jgi:hypothetical protein